MNARFPLRRPVQHSRRMRPGICCVERLPPSTPSGPDEQNRTSISGDVVRLFWTRPKVVRSRRLEGQQLERNGQTLDDFVLPLLRLRRYWLLLLRLHLNRGIVGSADNGLPQNSVRDIVQTRDGYLWFGDPGWIGAL